MSPTEPEEVGDEFSLIRRFFSGLSAADHVSLGPGDDAALLKLPSGQELVISTDTQIEGVHFPAQSNAGNIAYRAVAAAASDLAAMGAAPLGMTLALSLPQADVDWLQSLRSGLQAAVADFGLPLLGGDTVRGALQLSVTVLGTVPAGQALRRDGARVGDQLCVSGCLGDSAAGLALIEGRLDSNPQRRQLLMERFWRPQPALAMGVSLRGMATAAIDISDGLLADAAHVAEASDVCLEISSDQLPLSRELVAVAGRQQAVAWALSGGDDYVLCFTLPPGARNSRDCAVIGQVGRGCGVRVDGRAASATGFRHFP